MNYTNNKGEVIGSLDNAIRTTKASRSTASTMSRPSVSVRLPVFFGRNARLALTGKLALRNRAE